MWYRIKCLAKIQVYNRIILFYQISIYYINTFQDII